MDDESLLDNRDWDPEYLQKLFSQDFNNMSHLWYGGNYVTDKEISKVADRYCPIVEDISMDDEELRYQVEKIEIENYIPQ